MTSFGWMYDVDFSRENRFMNEYKKITQDMDLRVTPLSYMLKILTVLVFAKCFVFSTSELQESEDVWVCVQTGVERKDPKIRTNQSCVLKYYLDVIIHFKDFVIPYRFQRAVVGLEKGDYPVYHFSERGLDSVTFDSNSDGDGFAFQEVYRSRDSAIVLGCYQTVNISENYQISGVLKRNDTFWSIFPKLGENGVENIFSGYYLDESICYPHRILKLSSSPSLKWLPTYLGRKKRAAPYVKKFIIEVGLMIDATVTGFFIRFMPASWTIQSPKVIFILKEYYSFLLSSTSDIFKTLKPEANIRVRCSAMVYSSSYQESNWAKPSGGNNVSDSKVALRDFGTWLLNSSETALKNTHHIMLVTRYPLNRPIKFLNNKPIIFLNGFTWKSGLCTNDRFSILPETFDLSSILGAAQLIAYNFGIDIDGNNNTCPSNENFIMATNLDLTNFKENRSNIFGFSSCSKVKAKYLAEKDLRVRGCFSNGTRPHLLDVFHLMRTGQRFPANEQCLIKFGTSSNIYQCEKENFNNRYNFCTEMFCPSNGTCKSVFAFEGTSCGTKMWCSRGYCKSNRRAWDLRRDCWLGNRKRSVQVGNKIYTCKDIAYGLGSLCYIKEVRKQCCWSCIALNTGLSGCEYGDRIEQCWAKECFFYTKKKATYDCCHTCNYMPKRSAANPKFLDHSCVLCLLLHLVFHVTRQSLILDK